MNRLQQHARARRLITRALKHADQEYRARMNALLRDPQPTRSFREFMAERQARQDGQG